MSTESVTVPRGDIPSPEVPGRAPGNRSPFGLLVVILVLVNAAAIWGQAGWLYDNATPEWWEWSARVPIALGIATVIELIGVYLSQEAHAAQMANQSALMLRLGSFAIGGLAGWLNWQHWRPEGVEIAAVFATLSSISPVLWAVWSRARNRARLSELGMADPRGVKLSTSRKIWHPILSLRVIRWAAWTGVNDPAEAVRQWEAVDRKPAGRRTPEQVRAEVAYWKQLEPGLTQEQIAERMKLSSRRLRQVVNGWDSPTTEHRMVTR